jgi:hypothetical protein
MPSFDDRLAVRNKLVAQLVQQLSVGDFEGALRSAPRSRVNAEQIRNAVQQYGRTLVPLPAESYELIDHVVVLGSSPLAWSVVVPLFTKEEGRSDLSLELSLVEQAADGHHIEIDDIRVR